MKKYPDFNLDDEEIKKIEQQLHDKKQSVKNKLQQKIVESKQQQSITDDKIKINLNPEFVDNKTKNKRPFQYIEEMDIQKRANRIRKIINWWKKRKVSRVVLVNMEMRNGNHRTFIVYTSETGFEYNKCRYLFDNESSYYNVDFKFFCFDYHQDFTLPIKRIIPVKEINDLLTIESPEIVNATNPEVLEKLIISEIAKSILAGSSVWEFLRQARLIWIITLIIVVIDTLLMAWGFGLFDKLKG